MCAAAVVALWYFVMPPHPWMGWPPGPHKTLTAPAPDPQSFGAFDRYVAAAAIPCPLADYTEAQTDAYVPAGLTPERLAPHLGALREALAASGPSLAALHEACRTPGPSPTPRRLLLDVESLSSLRRLARAASAAAYLQALDGDPAKAVSTIGDTYTMGADLALDPPDLIAQMVGCDILRIDASSERLLLAQVDLSEESLAAHAQALSDLRARLGMPAGLFRREAVRQAALTQHFSALSTRDRLVATVQCVSIKPVASRRWLEDRCERLAEELAKLPATRDFEGFRAQAEADARVRGDVMADVVIGLAAKMAERLLRIDGDLVATETAVAVERFRSRHGAYPASLAELPPDLRDGLPVDPWSGQPLCYRREGNRYMLYAVGPDGRDDGGTWIRGQGGPDTIYMRPDAESEAPAGTE